MADIYLRVLLFICRLRSSRKVFYRVSIYIYAIAEAGSRLAEWHVLCSPGQLRRPRLYVIVIVWSHVRYACKIVVLVHCAVFHLFVCLVLVVSLFSLSGFKPSLRSVILP